MQTPVSTSEVGQNMALRESLGLVTVDSPFLSYGVFCKDFERSHKQEGTYVLGHRASFGEWMPVSISFTSNMLLSGLIYPSELGTANSQKPIATSTVEKLCFSKCNTG